MAKSKRRSPEDDDDRQAVRSAHRAGLRGEPDVLNTLALPAVFAGTTRRAEEAMRALCTERSRACNDDVALILADLHALVGPAPVALPNRSYTEDEERAARSVTRSLERRARGLQALGKVRTAQHEHEVELRQLAAHYNQVLARQVEAWRSSHPHARHLGDVVPAVVVVPDDARDIGQVALLQAARAVSRGANEIEWFLGTDAGDVA